MTDLTLGKPLTVCPACDGPIKYVAEPGRFAQYRTITCEFPADLEIPTCQDCGEMWLNGPVTHAISESFERQRLEQREKKSDG